MNIKKVLKSFVLLSIFPLSSCAPFETQPNPDLKPDTTVIESINLSGQLNKTNYFEGEKIDFAGLLTSAIYSDGSTTQLNSDQVNYVVDSGQYAILGDNKIEIHSEYNGLLSNSLAFDIVVNEYIPPKEYFTVTFLPYYEGVELVSGKTIQVVEDASQIEPPVFKRKGYDFIGWNVDLSTIHCDTTVIPCFEAHNFKIDYSNLTDDELVGLPTSYSVEENVFVPNLHRENEIFTGWTSAQITTPKIDFEIDSDLCSDVTLTANFYSGCLHNHIESGVCQDCGLVFEGERMTVSWKDFVTINNSFIANIVDTKGNHYYDYKCHDLYFRYQYNNENIEVLNERSPLAAPMFLNELFSEDAIATYYNETTHLYTVCCLYGSFRMMVKDNKPIYLKVDYISSDYSSDGDEIEFIVFDYQGVLRNKSIYSDDENYSNFDLCYLEFFDSYFVSDISCMYLDRLVLGDKYNGKKLIYGLNFRLGDQCKELVIDTNLPLAQMWYFLEYQNSLKMTLTSNCTNLKEVDGVIYTEDGTVLVYYPYYLKNKTFVVPEGVTSIDSYLYNVEVLDLYNLHAVPAYLRDYLDEDAKILFPIDLDINNSFGNNFDTTLSNNPNIYEGVEYAGVRDNPYYYALSVNETDVIHEDCRVVCTYSIGDNLLEVPENLSNIKTIYYFSPYFPDFNSLTFDQVVYNYRYGYELHLSNDIPYLTYKNGGIFTKDEKTILGIYDSEIEEYTIPEGVKYVAGFVTPEGSNLKTITFSSTIKKCDANFSDLVDTINFNEGLEYLSFQSVIKELVVPSTVKQVDSVLSWDENLTRIDIYGPTKFSWFREDVPVYMHNINTIYDLSYLTSNTTLIDCDFNVEYRDDGYFSADSSIIFKIFEGVYTDFAVYDETVAIFDISEVTGTVTINDKLIWFASFPESEPTYLFPNDYSTYVFPHHYPYTGDNFIYNYKS